MTPFSLAARLEPGTFDSKTGVFSGVSIITEGVAKGHGMLIDRVTIEQVLAAAGRFKSGVKVKADHWTGVAQIIGAITGLALDESGDALKLRGDLALLKNLRDRAFYQEVLEVFADAIGLSITCYGTRENIDGLDYLRVVELRSIDLVDDPAANPNGLLSRRVDNEPEGMPKTLTAALTAADLATQLTGLSAADSLATLQAAYVAMSCACKTAQDAKTGLDTQLSTVTKERDDAKTALGTVTKERDDAKAELATATKDRDDAKASLATVTKERDDAKTELATLKPEHADYLKRLEQLASKGLTASPKKAAAPGDDDAKTMARAAFDALKPSEQSAFCIKGGTITD